MAWNAAILLVLFLISLFPGSMRDTCGAKFGAIMASVAHFLAVVGMIVFFEVLVPTFYVTALQHLMALF